ncbi:MAG: DNA-formamidopyrimidine glycosylase [Candidatus Nealsonbacteria bacterium]|nr:DNA-formamidopyrimidine glycosylase [Candidatus Nealsonbacteria bacterium]
MPELPEVETIRSQLNRKIVGKKLDGKMIIKVRRRAKLLIIDFKDGSSLVFHLKLTGQLIFNGEVSSHTRKVFKFNGGSKLVFNDMRKFGWWKFVKNTKEMEEKFGPESLAVSFKTFKNLLMNHSKAKIKPLLMDQKVIAGIGNIYSDEILFAAKVHPLRQAETLKDKEVRQIFKSMRKILNLAVKHHGSSVQDYLDSCGEKGDYVKYHKVYQKEGKKCARCQSLIKRIKISGRSTHFCPACQSLALAGRSNCQQ